MKKTFNMLFIALILIVSSCSTYIERTPAEAESEIFTEVFSFMPNASDSKTDLYDEALKKIQAHSGDNYEARKIEIEKVKSLPNGAAFKVELVKDPKNPVLMIFKVQSTPKAFKDIAATHAMMNFVISLLEKSDLGSGHAAFEMYYNAKAGDLVALENFVKIKARNPTYGLGANGENVFVNDYKKYNQDLASVKEKLADDIKKLKKARVMANDKRKIGLDALDKAPEGKQFRALIAKNDRKGAMAVLKKYLPWEDMAPFEKQFWENYITITENPVPLEQRVIIYRGLDEDFIHRATVGAKELSEKEAILTGNSFIMSSGMVKNQGSWNRRLRSLEAMNQKFIATVGMKDEYAQSARISVMFDNHAAEPKGSPFISLTPDFGTAENFGSKRVSSYLIDPRLLNFNYASTFDTEYEFLIPLTTFPDDMVGIADIDFLLADKDLDDDSATYLEKRLEKVITQKYGEAKKDKIIAQIKKNTFDFFEIRYPYGKEAKTPGVGVANQKFYKNFLTNKDPTQPMKPNGELTCKDLIELFWMAK